MQAAYICDVTCLAFYGLGFGVALGHHGDTPGSYSGLQVGSNGGAPIYTLTT